MHASNATNADNEIQMRDNEHKYKKRNESNKTVNRTEKESERITENRNIDKQNKKGNKNCMGPPMLPFSQTLPQWCPGPKPNRDVVPGSLDIPMGQAESMWWKVSPTGGLPFSYPKHISQYGTKSRRHRTCDPRKPKGTGKRMCRKVFPDLWVHNMI